MSVISDCYHPPDQQWLVTRSPMTRHRTWMVPFIHLPCIQDGRRIEPRNGERNPRPPDLRYSAARERALPRIIGLLQFLPAPRLFSHSPSCLFPSFHLPSSTHLLEVIMSAAKSRLSSLLGHFAPSHGGPTASPAQYEHSVNFHTLSPTTFLPRAAAIEPEVSH